MTTLFWIAVVVLAGVALTWGIRRWRRTTEARLITCPETGRREAVEVDPLHRLGRAATGHDDMRLRSCSRWPERQDCDQPCLEQISQAPDGCRVRSILDVFYADGACVACGREFGASIDWSVHTPGLKTEDGRVITWRDAPTQDLEQVLEGAEPVCWDCLQVVKVYQKHPELVTERDDREPVRTRQAQG